MGHSSARSPSASHSMVSLSPTFCVTSGVALKLTTWGAGTPVGAGSGSVVVAAAGEGSVGTGLGLGDSVGVTVGDLRASVGIAVGGLVAVGSSGARVGRRVDVGSGSAVVEDVAGAPTVSVCGATLASRTTDGEPHAANARVLSTAANSMRTGVKHLTLVMIPPAWIQRAHLASHSAPRHSATPRFYPRRRQCASMRFSLTRQPIAGQSDAMRLMGLCQ
jgi:hypothetical protein